MFFVPFLLSPPFLDLLNVYYGPVLSFIGLLPLFKILVVSGFMFIQLTTVSLQGPYNKALIFFPTDLFAFIDVSSPHYIFAYKE